MFYAANSVVIRVVIFIQCFHGNIQIAQPEEFDNLRAKMNARKKEIEQEINNLRTIMVQNKIEFLKQEAVDLVQGAGVLNKSALVEDTREMLRTLNRVKADGQTQLSNLLAWSASYLADNFPMAPTAISFYVSAINWADSFVSGSECDLIYQIVRYLFLVVSLGYLTLMGHRTSTTSGFLKFLGAFWVNWVVFTLMMMTMMALPPLPCYGSWYGKVVNVLGVVGLVVLAVTLNAINKPASRFVFVLNLNMYSNSEFYALLSVMVDTVWWITRNRRK